jgi:streptogramin lyase
LRQIVRPLALAFLCAGCSQRALPLPEEEVARPFDLAAPREPDLAAPADLSVALDLASAADLSAPLDLTSADLLLPLLSEFAIPTKNGAGPLASGADGNLWLAETFSGQIARISVQGVITEFPLPDRASNPQGIAAGPDGNIWFTESARARVGRITSGGTITEFPLSNTTPVAICSGPDGNLWVSDVANAQAIRVTPS